jgi:hypothetical protein
MFNFFGQFMKNTKDQCEMIMAILNLINNYKNKYGKDPLYNNYYRQVLQANQLVDFFGGDQRDVIIKEWSGEIDIVIECMNIHNGEMKGIWHDKKKITKKNLGKMRFDKQDNEHRRNAIYLYDFFMFSAFARLGLIKYSIWTWATKKLHPLIKIYQEDKLKEIEKYKSMNKRLPRDDIAIKVLDVINVLDNEDLFIIYNDKQITKEEFLWSI